ncbi:type II toxin-antitoxin system Phd/YefM family antitoxin [Nocardioides sp. NPDC057772]|uniref:type II toxin-antitoxin system Phd/YefM family antitoxin n=1 Tax=Nocardioides sp. NPDC057772 TaxID=3346245 RepID=UPI0036714952
MPWQVQEAKQRFSEVLREATAGGPQLITKHGEEIAVVLSIDDYRRIAQPRRPLSEYLLDVPKGDDLDLDRDRSDFRELDLEGLA